MMNTYVIFNFLLTKRANFIINKVPQKDPITSGVLGVLLRVF